MPSGAVSPAEPVTGLMMARPQPLPAKRRLSSGLSATYKSDGRRRKKETAAPFKATLIFNYNTHLSATVVPTLRVGRRRLVSGSSAFMPGHSYLSRTNMELQNELRSGVKYLHI